MYIVLYYDISVTWNLDFDVRVGTINRGRQTRWRTVPECRTDGLATGSGNGGSSGDGVIVRGFGADLLVVAISVVYMTTAATAARKERTDSTDGCILDDDPRTPDHWKSQHFHRLGRRNGHHIVTASD